MSFTESFLPNEPANNRFIDGIIKHFQTTQNFNDFRGTLANFFKNLPLPKFQVFQQKLHNFVPTPSSPSSGIARPSTTPGRTPMSRYRTSTPFGMSRPQAKIQTKTPLIRRRAVGRRIAGTRMPFQERLDSLDDDIIPVKAKVQQQVRNLSQSNLEKSIKEPSMRQKLEAFTNNFCKSMKKKNYFN